MDHDSVDVLRVQVVQRMLHEGFAAGNPDIVDELCSPDLVEHQFGLSRRRSVRDRQAQARHPDRARSVSRPAVHCRRHRPSIGDTVWIRAEATGRTPVRSSDPPTGKPVHFTVIDVATVRDGRIVEHWGVPDRFAILAHTGQLERLAS